MLISFKLLEDYIIKKIYHIRLILLLILYGTIFTKYKFKILQLTNHLSQATRHNCVSRLWLTFFSDIYIYISILVIIGSYRNFCET